MVEVEPADVRLEVLLTVAEALEKPGFLVDDP